MNKWRARIVRIPPFFFFVLVISYAIVACAVLTTERLAKGWPGIAIYAIGCVLVFLAFVRKSTSEERKRYANAEQASRDQTAQIPSADSLERVEKLREHIRKWKVEGANKE